MRRFSTTFGAQTGLAIIPLLCFGTPAQQQKYLPRLVTGEIIGAYCLSESGSGSDALGARTKATRLPDGSWSITGEKMWITNGGFADLFIVFAKVDGEHFTAFIVERGIAGVSSGKEEHKMGLHGSSTTPLVLQDARVPADNLLGEIGRGHKIAFNVLNYGRFKLAAMCTRRRESRARRSRADTPPAGDSSGSRSRRSAPSVTSSPKWRSASTSCESMLYPDHRPHRRRDRRVGRRHGSAVAAALEEFAIEASLLKVAGSEMIDFVVDESVQIHGGNGFVARLSGGRAVSRCPRQSHLRGHERDQPPADSGAHRQTRRKRVRGTTTVRRVRQVRRVRRVRRVRQVRQSTGALKKVALMAIGLAVETYGDALAQEQEVLTLLSDIVLDTFAAESAALRAAAADAGGHRDAAVHAAVATVAVHDASLRIEMHARTALAAMRSGAALDSALDTLKNTLTVAPANTIAARRLVADAVTESRGYPFNRQ